MVSVLLFGLFVPAVWAQSGPGYRLSNCVFNQGGHPLQGASATSPSFLLRPAAIGESIVAVGLASPSYRLDAGFGGAFVPPGEVQGLRIRADRTTLEWSATGANIKYDLYRDLLTNLAGRQYGNCLQGHIPGVTFSDASVPPARDGFFYLVTAEDRLGEEGTKGWDSTGARRANNAPCP
jgi:hypothetical protein